MPLKPLERRDCTGRFALHSCFCELLKQKFGMIHVMPHHEQAREKYHEETPDHRLRHLYPVPVSVWLACGNKHTCLAFNYSYHGFNHHGQHAERLPGPAQSASPTQSAVPASRRSAQRGSGSCKPATNKRSGKEAHQTASVYRPGASATEIMLQKCGLSNSQSHRFPQRVHRDQGKLSLWSQWAQCCLT